jgi:hypothetical protein
MKIYGRLPNESRFLPNGGFWGMNGSIEGIEKIGRGTFIDGLSTVNGDNRLPFLKGLFKHKFHKPR